MALAPQVGDILNTQINKELYSAYLYMTFADYYEGRGLKGFANWYMIQAAEEVDHAKILRRYLLDNDYPVKMLAIDEPNLTFDDDMGPLKAALEHEQYVTSLINDCYAAAFEIRDFRTMQMLDWFVKEQNEEEANATEMVSNMELFGADPKGLHALDREYLARTHTPTTSMPM